MRLPRTYKGNMMVYGTTLGVQTSMEELQKQYGDAYWWDWFAETETLNDRPVSIRLIKDPLLLEGDLIFNEDPWAIIIDNIVDVQGTIICDTPNGHISSLVVLKRLEARNLFFSNNARLSLEEDALVGGYVVGTGGQGGESLSVGGNLVARAVLLDSQTSVMVNYISALIMRGPGWPKPDFLDGEHPELFSPRVLDKGGPFVDFELIRMAAQVGVPVFEQDEEAIWRKKKGFFSSEEEERKEPSALSLELFSIKCGRDEKELSAFMKRLTPGEFQQHKEELAEVWYWIYSSLLYDYSWGKVKTDDPETFFPSLLNMLTTAEKINPPKIFYRERADCYQSLAKVKNTQDVQLGYIEKAIAEISEALRNEPTSRELNNDLIDILLDKIKINDQYTDDEFIEVLGCYTYALSEYTVVFPHSLLRNCYKILGFSFPENQHWYGVFMETFAETIHEAAKKDTLIYLKWVDELRMINDDKYENIPPAYRQEIERQIVVLLKLITDDETEEPEVLNELGYAFSNSASKLSKLGAITEALSFYEVAVQYYTKAQTVKPTEWHNAESAAIVLMAMAVIYHNQQDRAKVIEVFEKGKAIFSKVYKHKKHYTLNVAWGEFLIEYARLAYDFKEPAILQEAAAKLMWAKKLGYPYTDDPYYGLAKIALKLGDKEKCLAILTECKAVISECYRNDLSRAIEDEGFKEIKQEIISIDN